MRAEYGAENQIKTFIATDASTRTESAPVKGKAAPPSLTWSKGLTAHFDEKSGDLTHLEQWDNFRYEEGDRRAKADRADLHSPSRYRAYRNRTILGSDRSNCRGPNSSEAKVRRGRSRRQCGFHTPA